MLLALAAGGALGTGARDWIATSMHVGASGFPWPTFLVNVGGSLILGCGLIMILERLPPGRYFRPFFAAGLCGGFTTFSTLVVEAGLLVHGGRSLETAVYLMATALCGLAASAFGLIIGRALPLELAPLFGHRIKARVRRQDQ